jgi:hypothetical protein
MWRGGRAPFALPNVPRTVGRAPWAAGPAPSTAGRVARLTALNYDLRQLTVGPVGPRRGARHCWLSARPVARGSRIARRGSASGIKVHVFHKQY